MQVRQLRLIGQLLAVIHVAGPTTTRYAFARTYARLAGFDPELIRRTSLQPGATIFPDLSLASEVTPSLGFAPTPHDVALAHLVAEAADAERAA